MNKGGELENLDYNTEPMRNRNPTLRLQQPWSLSPERWSELQRNTGRHYVSSFSRIHRNSQHDHVHKNHGYFIFIISEFNDGVLSVDCLNYVICEFVSTDVTRLRPGCFQGEWDSSPPCLAAHFRYKVSFWKAMRASALEISWKLFF